MRPAPHGQTRLHSPSRTSMVTGTWTWSLSEMGCHVGSCCRLHCAGVWCGKLVLAGTFLGHHSYTCCAANDMPTAPAAHAGLHATHVILSYKVTELHHCLLNLPVSFLGHSEGRQEEQEVSRLCANCCLLSFFARFAPAFLETMLARCHGASQMSHEHSLLPFAI